jgi:hypothetical protein
MKTPCPVPIKKQKYFIIHAKIFAQQLVLHISGNSRTSQQIKMQSSKAGLK